MPRSVVMLMLTFVAILEPTFVLILMPTFVIKFMAKNGVHGSGQHGL